MNTILRVSNLNFRYDTVNVITDISFEVQAGDYIGLVGHNGSGKTTLIKVILGLLKPNSGDVFLFEKSIQKFQDWNKVGYMPQNLSLFNPIFPATVEEVVSLGLLSVKRFPKKINRGDIKIVESSLEKLNIVNLRKKLISSLSGGQQQRVFLARALITKPELLILDEPSNALDAASRNQFFSILSEFNRNGTAIILITHDVAQVGEIANKLLYLDKNIIFFGSFGDFCKSEKMSQQFGLDSQHIICHQHHV
jgi:zinc transport system ATP-binding protein